MRKCAATRCNIGQGQGEKIARVAEGYGGTYDKVEEHDAYYLASATLLPRSGMISAVATKTDSAEIARKFGTSPELVDHRVKRLAFGGST